MRFIYIVPYAKYEQELVNMLEEPQDEAAKEGLIMSYTKIQFIRNTPDAD